MTRTLPFCMLLLCAAAAAQAATIGTFDFGRFVQSGTVTNLSGQVMTGFEINLTMDHGDDTPIWERPAPGPGKPGAPAAGFSLFGDADGAFVAAWTGLAVGDGDRFSYSGMDIGTWNGFATDESRVPIFDGSEWATVTFADGSVAVAQFTAGTADRTGTLVFDADRIAPMPLPAGIWLLAGALGLLAVIRRKRGGAA
ncbi:MAG: putative extracellular protein [Rhodobacteraceae bacterium HLUCCA08]|nr:MAG: putative extracellular protein [Rhodobacteraceae bacterium HLUCCA08]